MIQDDVINVLNEFNHRWDLEKLVRERRVTSGMYSRFWVTHGAVCGNWLFEMNV